MTAKKKEGLAPRTITEDYQHYDYLKEYIGEDITNENFTIEDFQEYNFFFHVELPSEN